MNCRYIYNNKQYSKEEILNLLNKEQLGSEDLVSYGENVAGFTYKGDVYLNKSMESINVNIHEFGHLHLDWLKENKNLLYKAGLSLVTKNKTEAQQYIDIVKQTQPDLVEGSEKFLNEVLAQVIGDNGAKLFENNKKESIADWLKSVWESIKDILGLSEYTAEQVANMTLEQFGKASATEMLSGSRIQRDANTTNSDISFSVLSDYRDNNRFAYSDLIYPDVVFKDINKPQDVKTATNFYKKIVAKFNKTFDRDLKIETSEKGNDFKVTVEYETGLRPKYFAYPTAVMGEHSTVDDIDKNVPLTSLRHELIHEMLVKNITDKFERINNLDNSANIESIEEVQRNRAYNYTLEDVFFERVVENVERNPDNKDTFEVSTFGTDVINALKKELGEEDISKEKVISTLKTLLEGSNSWLSSTLLDIFENKLEYNIEDLSDLSESLGEKFKTKFIASKNIFSKELQEKINDFTKFFNEEYTGVLTRLDKKRAKPQDIVSGNKLFNEPLEEASTIADEYTAEKGLSAEPIQKITKLDTDNSKRIAEEFDKMEATPNNPETKVAYKAMVDETLEQYEKILSKGYRVEINNSEPYDSSADMIKDLRDNKRMRIFSTESGFGDEDITDKQRVDNPLLQETKYKDANGLPLLANDIFRFVHDFFGHAKFGNGFGAIGEENAWNIHARMYSPLARRAMTTETRGQNSWVNFSGVNDEAFKKRDEARKLRQEGKSEEAKKLTEEVYETMSFAEQKVGLLPEWVSTPRIGAISPENSSNYANLTEDGKGNFVFFHRGGDNYETIRRSTGGTLATSREEAAALSKVGGLAMYYTRQEDSESMVSGTSKYLIKVPTDKVYDVNTDVLGLKEKGKIRHEGEHPGKAYDGNTAAAYITKLAGELGYEMAVVEWDGRTRAQTTKEFAPEDTQKMEGNVIKTPFKENYTSNTEKGYKPYIPVKKEDKLHEVYLEMERDRNRKNDYTELYRMHYDFRKFTQEEITRIVDESDLPQEIKDKYRIVVNSPEETRKSIRPQEDINFKKVLREPSLELNGTKIFAKDRINPITGEEVGDIELELIESSDKGKGNARKAAEVFLNSTDTKGKNVYLIINPRNSQTTPEGLESFYSSLGFTKISDFEMVREAQPITTKEVDSNGEPSVKTVMDFSNAKADPLTTEEVKVARNVAMSLGVKSSTELLDRMEKALVKNGVVVFDKLTLQRSKLYNIFELNSILSSPELQNKVKESFLSLRNTEPFTVEYNQDFVVAEDITINQFGKQTVSNPYVLEKEITESIAGLEEDDVKEALPNSLKSKYETNPDFKKSIDDISKSYKTTTVKTVKDEELVDKVEDIEGLIRNTVTGDSNPSLLENIAFLKTQIDEDVWMSKLNSISKLLNKIKKDAMLNGIDLRNLPTLSLQMTRDEVLDFTDSLINYLLEPNNPDLLEEFSAEYEKVLGDKEQVVEAIQTDSENDIMVDEPLSEYQMFTKFGLVKKQDNIYREVEDQDLETLYANFFANKNKLPEGVETIQDLKTFVQNATPSLEVYDYEVDTDNLEKLVLLKKFFDFSMSTVSPKINTDNVNKITNTEEFLAVDFVKEFNKWILFTNNPYFKVTNKGIELASKDEISKQEAIESIPARFKQELSEYNIISTNLNLELPLEEEQFRDIDTQFEERQKVVNNPERVQKLSGQYTYLKDGVLVAKNESNTFVRTPIGVFEKIFEFGNIKFYGKLDTFAKEGYKKVVPEAPFSDIDFNEYRYLESSPEVFKTSKNYYSKEELNKINDEFFDCQ